MIFWSAFGGKGMLILDVFCFFLMSFFLGGDDDRFVF